jgi:hypothetical protein
LQAYCLVQDLRLAASRRGWGKTERIMRRHESGLGHILGAGSSLDLQSRCLQVITVPWGDSAFQNDFHP